MFFTVECFVDYLRDTVVVNRLLGRVVEHPVHRETPIWYLVTKQTFYWEKNLSSSCSEALTLQYVDDGYLGMRIIMKIDRNNMG